MGHRHMLQGMTDLTEERYLLRLAMRNGRCTVSSSLSFGMLLCPLFIPIGFQAMELEVSRSQSSVTHPTLCPIQTTVALVTNHTTTALRPRESYFATPNSLSTTG